MSFLIGRTKTASLRAGGKGAAGVGGPGVLRAALCALIAGVWQHGQGSQQPRCTGGADVPLQGTAVEAAALLRGSADGIRAIAASGRIDGSCVHDAHGRATFFCCMIMSVEVCLACSQGDRSFTLT